MKKRFLLAVATLPLLTGCSGMGGFFGGNDLDYASPQGFLVEAAAARSKQEALSDMAIKHTRNPAVRAYAQQMLSDAKADDPAMAALAQRYNVKFPAPITPEDQYDLDTMEHLAPSVFDAHYLDESMNDQRDMLDIYTAAANRNSADVAQYAQGQRARLRADFNTAVDMDSRVGGQLYRPYNE